MNPRAVDGLLLIDTEVLIDDLRDEPGAVAFLEATEQPLAASAINIAELDVGVRDGVERQRLDAFVEVFVVLPLDRQATVEAGLWRRHYGPSYGTVLADAFLADALIAASAEGAGATLVTLNRRHFPMLAHVLVPYAKG